MKNLILFFLVFQLNGSFSQDSIPLKPCPSAPNCVCTYGKKARKNMAVLTFKTDLNTSKAALKTLVLALEGTVLTEERTDYLHFEFHTSIGKFIDDVEFYLDDSTKIIHYRSASRIGFGDFGANKRRMKMILEQWNKLD